MTTHIEALTAALNAIGIKAKAWEGTSKDGDQIKRIYLPSSPAVSVFIDIAKPDAEAKDGQLFKGCEIKAFTKTKKAEGGSAE